MSTARPRYARPFVAVFLAVLVVCAIVPLNLWPFSNWELFSRLRTPVVTSWEAVAVERNRTIVDYAISGATTCGPLLRSADARLGPTTRVTVYHLERLLSHRVGRHAAAPRRTRAYTCTTKGGHATS
jgi:hypothetical protein